MSDLDIYAYVDETGDRGHTPQSSPIFGMAAVLADRAAAFELRAAVTQLRADMGVQRGTALSWKEHLKTHDRRRRAADVLGAVKNIQVCYVYAQKDQLNPNSYVGDRVRFYNYVALKTYKSILWGARNWKGNDAQLWTRFGHVRHHDNTITEQYLQKETANDAKVPDHIEQGLRWVSADRYLESQAADMYGGFLKAAIWPSGAWAYTEPSYLLSVWHQIRNSGDCAVPLGIMSMPSNDVLHGLDWFPCESCPKKRGAAR